MKAMKDYSVRRLKNACPQCGTAIRKGNRSSDHGWTSGFRSHDDGLVVRAILRDYLATEVHWA